jgi:hypothetical protein
VEAEAEAEEEEEATVEIWACEVDAAGLEAQSASHAARLVGCADERCCSARRRRGSTWYLVPSRRTPWMASKSVLAG